MNLVSVKGLVLLTAMNFALAVPPAVLTKELLEGKSLAGVMLHVALHDGGTRAVVARAVVPLALLVTYKVDSPIALCVAGEGKATDADSDGDSGDNNIIALLAFEH